MTAVVVREIGVIITLVVKFETKCVLITLNGKHASMPNYAYTAHLLAQSGG